jgi:hydrogenase maturation protease
VTTVVGLGQATAGDDAVGCWVARALVAQGIAARESADATLLLSLLEQGEHVILVDAVVAAIPVGSVLHLRPEALARAALSPVSSHGLSVAQALQLGRTLYPDACAQLDIVAIAIARPCEQATTLSTPVRAALGEACALVQRLVAARSQSTAHTPERS